MIGRDNVTLTGINDGVDSSMLQLMNNETCSTKYVIKIIINMKTNTFFINVHNVMLLLASAFEINKNRHINNSFYVFLIIFINICITFIMTCIFNGIFIVKHGIQKSEMTEL